MESKVSLYTANILGLFTISLFQLVLILLILEAIKSRTDNCIGIAIGIIIATLPISIVLVIKLTIGVTP